MTQTAAIWLVIAAAFAAANLPFLSERWLIAGPRVKGGPKPFGMPQGGGRGRRGLRPP